MIQNDFTKNFDAKTFEDMWENKLKDLDISVLVNNVGMSGAIAEPLVNNTDQDVHNVMSCNMYGAVLLTHQVIKSFKRRFEDGGKRSCITFTSALAGIAPLPTVAVYAASKIFNDYLTWGLGYELKKYNVDVSSWRAAGVSTNMIGNIEPNPMTASPA